MMTFARAADGLRLLRLALAVLASVCLIQWTASAGAPPEGGTARDGQSLALQLRGQSPTQPWEMNGQLRRRDSKGKTLPPVRLRFATQPETNAWHAIYEAFDDARELTESLVVVHREGKPNAYMHSTYPRENDTRKPDTRTLRGGDAEKPFAGSDFYLTDFGLEFLYWPGQKILKHEMRKGRSCYVLESTRPEASGERYARVLSWVDVENGGILRAEAYDASNRQLKEFSIGSVKKVDGRWQIKSMEIRDARTDARSRLEFDLEVEE